MSMGFVFSSLLSRTEGPPSSPLVKWMRERERLVWQTAANSRGNKPSIEIISKRDRERGSYPNPCLLKGRAPVLFLFCWSHRSSLQSFRVNWLFFGLHRHNCLIFFEPAPSMMTASFISLTRTTTHTHMHRERECRLCLCKSFVPPAKNNNISFERAVSFLEIGTHFILCVRPRRFKTTSFLFEKKTKTNERVQWDHWRMWPVSSFSPPFLIFIYLFIRRGATTSGYARGIFRDPHPTARHLKYFFFFRFFVLKLQICVAFSSSTWLRRRHLMLHKR